MKNIMLGAVIIYCFVQLVLCVYGVIVALRSL